MRVSRAGVALVALGALTLAGCNSARMSSIDTRPQSTVAQPLEPAPAGQVASAGQLPPPGAPGLPPADPAAFPAAPTGETLTPPTQTAAATPPSGPAIAAGSVAGVWNATVAGQGCRVATPQTKFGAGYRAGPLRCPAPLDGVKSWNVEGSQLALYDQNGGVLARLYSSGASRFDGQTTSGQPVSLSR
jgi:hypothetical protein